ncbi:C4-type zinc ribbon domain-containing protein [Lentzea sp. BCCO 10_0798]|uniref:C4-type zinc ribbon domain-containing protein n=1 Tax=Lentzea kristufekii TaxID=3095430 RepID=A0ABU4U4W8_9PSEU|nr:C4-type zinc ribbon domain-containing protein [Lentzea sp. BCCO 10_0798]MDX8055625.1 C4-type zinc ribbon domain-containing protein [Lentzea sp. BCCO 10_0798]
MKADPAVQRRLLDLAAVDAELARVTHRRRTLPEIAEIAEAEQQVRAKQDALVAVETTLTDLDRDVKRQETEIDQVRARGERDRKLMQSGSVGAKQLTDLEHELATIQRRQGILEDDLLELMERREAVDADASFARVELDKARETLKDAAARRDQALADLEATETRRTADRSTMAKGFPDDLLKLYDRQREQRGIGAAPFQSRRCGACRIELDSGAVSKLKEAAADEIVRCEECGTILVRIAEPKA